VEDRNIEYNERFSAKKDWIEPKATWNKNIQSIFLLTTPSNNLQ
jgi:hypothetical protein